MKTNLPCEVVRDLLPSYKDGLTSEVTNEAVEEHLAGCEECSQTLERMCDPIEPAVVQPEGDKTIDFLKKVRRVDRWKIIAACVAVLVLVGVGIKLVQTYVGHDITASVDKVSVKFEDGVLSVDGSFEDANLTVLRARLVALNMKDTKGNSLNGYYRLQIEGRDYKAGSSEEQVSDFHVEKQVNGDVNAVYLADNGWIVWSGGRTITLETYMFNQSVMDEYKNLRQQGSGTWLTGFFELNAFVGDTHSDVNWDGNKVTIEMEKAMGHEFERMELLYCERYAYALLAGIEKLDSVEFTWVCDQEGRRSETFTREQADAFIGGDIAEMAGTLAGKQNVLRQLGLVTDYWHSSELPVNGFMVTSTNDGGREVLTVDGAGWEEG